MTERDKQLHSAQLGVAKIELQEELRFYDIQGVEITDEDADAVLNYMEYDNMTMDEAVHKTLTTISECLEQGMYE